MAVKFEISEVRLLEKEEYLVIVKISEGSVTAVLEISLGARRKHRGEKHYMKPFEMLHEGAKERVANLCHKLSDSLKTPATHN